MEMQQYWNFWNGLLSFGAVQKNITMNVNKLIENKHKEVWNDLPQINRMYNITTISGKHQLLWLSLIP